MFGPVCREVNNNNTSILLYCYIAIVMYYDIILLLYYCIILLVYYYYIIYYLCGPLTGVLLHRMRPAGCDLRDCHFQPGLSEDKARRYRRMGGSVGRGSFGSVYMAMDTAMDTIVAIKQQIVPSKAAVRELCFSRH